MNDEKNMEMIKEIFKKLEKENEKKYNNEKVERDDFAPDYSVYGYDEDYDEERDDFAPDYSVYGYDEDYDEERDDFAPDNSVYGYDEDYDEERDDFAPDNSVYGYDEDVYNKEKEDLKLVKKELLYAIQNNNIDYNTLKKSLESPNTNQMILENPQYKYILDMIKKVLNGDQAGHELELLNIREKKSENQEEGYGRSR